MYVLYYISLYVYIHIIYPYIKYRSGSTESYLKYTSDKVSFLFRSVSNRTETTTEIF